jgi:hypothetical protein
LLIPFVAGATTDYLLVDDLPFIGKTTNIASYLKGLFQLGLGLAVLGSVFMLVVNGSRYMVSDITNEKAKARLGMKDAVVGLLIIFLSVLGLNTINPRLTEFNLIDTIERTVQAIKAGQATRPQPPSGGDAQTAKCTGCVTVPSDVTIKSGIACQSNVHGCQISSGMLTSLRGLNTNLRGTTDWQVTEAFPPAGYTTANPKGIHDSACHGNGTCIDANITGPASASNVFAFLRAADKAGLRAVYEVTTQGKKDVLVTAGVPAEDISVNTGATGDHFHVTD